MELVEVHAPERTVMMLDRLREIFGSDAEVARQTGVDPSQLSRWRRGQEPSDPAWDRLVDLFAVAQKLEGFYEPRRLRAWLEGPNLHLGDRSPLYLLRHGGTGDVISAIQSLKAGTFGQTVPKHMLWRVFPWDPRAKSGRPLSPSYLPAQSGYGRFDLDRGLDASTWYFAGAPEHAVAERIQDLRNRTLFDDMLFERGRRLALVSVDVAARIAPIDLCDPIELARPAIPPDHLAYRDSDVTRAIATLLHRETPAKGLRWWSAFFGEWHTTALFSDRLGARDLDFGDPEPLQLDSPAVVAAAAALAIEIG